MVAKERLRGVDLVVVPEKLDAALWRRLKCEDDRDARMAIFERYRPFSVKVARGLYRNRANMGLDYVDFEQLAYAGLLEAMDSFEPDRGIPFEAFAQLRIKGSINDDLRLAREQNAQLAYIRRKDIDRVQSLLPAAESKNSATQKVAEIAIGLAIGLLLESAGLAVSKEATDNTPGSFESLAFKQLQHAVYAEIENLPAPEDRIILGHYLNGIAFVNLARLLNLSKGRISQLHKQALARLRKSLKHFF